MRTLPTFILETAIKTDNCYYCKH